MTSAVARRSAEESLAGALERSLVGALEQDASEASEDDLTIPTTLAERVLAARKARAMGSRELSALVQASPALVSQIESGKTQMMQADTAVRMARLLGVRIAWLVLGEGPARGRRAP